MGRFCGIPKRVTEMSKDMKTLLIAGAILIGGAAQAQAQPRDSGDGNPDATVCRIVNDTGSRLDRVRVCKTRAEWAAERRGARNSERPQNRSAEERDSD